MAEGGSPMAAQDPAQPQPSVQHTAGDPTPGQVGRPRLFPGLYRQATPAPTPPPHDPSDAQAQAARDLQANLATLLEAQAEQHARTLDLLAAAHGALTLLTNAQRPGEQHSLSISASRGYTLEANGYQHSYLLLAASGAVTFDIPGIGVISRTLNADWNRLCYPSGTRISLASGSDINALLWLTNDNINV